MGWSNTKSEEVVESLKDIKDEIKSKYKIHDTIVGDSKFDITFVFNKYICIFYIKTITVHIFINLNTFLQVYNYKYS